MFCFVIDKILRVLKNDRKMESSVAVKHGWSGTGSRLGGEGTERPKGARSLHVTCNCEQGAPGYGPVTDTFNHH